MLLSFGIFVLTTSPQELVDELEKKWIFSKVWLYYQFCISDIATDAGCQGCNCRCTAKPRYGNRRKYVGEDKSIPAIDFSGGDEFADQYQERAIALEVRGFGRKQKKTWLYDRPKCKWDPVVRGILVFLLVLVIVWRIW